MYEAINEQLIRVRSAMSKKKKWEIQLADYERELIEIEMEISRLEKQVIAEKKDVQKLERIGITNLIQTLFGSKHEKLRQEKQEVIAIQLQLEEAEKTKHEISDSINELHDKLQGVMEADQDYQVLLSAKEQMMKEKDAAFGNRLFELNETEGDLAAYMMELDEAIEAGNKVKLALNNAMDSLESAEGWGTFDMFGGGMISTMVKHDHIDKATNHIHHAQTSMRSFQKELLDVDEVTDFQIDISGMLKFADFFFDGLIVDWMVQGRIQDSLQQARDQHAIVVSIIRKLNKTLKEKEIELSTIQAAKMQLIEER
ncbi:hypothetical protein [Oceanobacillus polygoni]|uniref:Uncharacterized protein n=1 Tax=Oceanobacillus polygoni TaxID=1235259 RepID=A0A9X0YW25_9BACI|nr:hypothetical protein [Oceanobacillus polygoni]MBP2078046.1 hypothetical protein [Oceanobacillus polygoni]